jgi:peptidoglycan/xylan/chitin deacetylase (PgdA/CDA1 family)
MIEGLIIAVMLMGISMMKLAKQLEQESSEALPVIAQNNSSKDKEITPTQATISRKEEEELLAKQERDDYLKAADRLAASYDYDKAIEYVKAYKVDYTSDQELLDAIKIYEKKKAECDNLGAYDSTAQVNHIFFHSLIYDTSKAFDNQYDSNGYNYYMTTVYEFKEMMHQMYEDGYVLVSMHDLVKKVKNEDGTYAYAEGDIMLPIDKKPFVLSQDDVNYYDFMDEDGFASRIVLDENGRPSTEMILDDGTTSVGDYDLVPILESFIEEHPDFSYRGARGIIALTGYEGTLGYRTDPAFQGSETYDQDREAVTEIAKVMREYGWEFACHSNGHRNMAECTQSFLEYDTKEWLEYVGALVGETDIYVYPYGIDVQAGIDTYSNDKYQYLKESGFSIFLGVEAKPWIQIKKDYVRMQRRPLDGQAMLQYPKRVEDLFDLTTVIDPTRPELD